MIETEEKEKGIWEVRLNRPEKRNALSVALMRSLVAALEEIEANPGARVIILRGNGPVFCAGLDLKEASAPGDVHESAQWVRKVLLAVHGSPLVTIAAVHGAALAGGAGIMSACDLAVATKGSRFGYPEVKRGLIAAQVMPFLLGQVGERHARELLLLGESIEAERARDMGLINAVVSEDMLLEAAHRIAFSASSGAPAAIKQTKQLLSSLRGIPFSEAMEKAFTFHLHARESEEAREGMAAFLEKRQPKWTSL